MHCAQVSACARAMHTYVNLNAERASLGIAAAAYMNVVIQLTIWSSMSSRNETARLFSMTLNAPSPVPIRTHEAATNWTMRHTRSSCRPRAASAAIEGKRLPVPLPYTCLEMSMYSAIMSRTFSASVRLTTPEHSTSVNAVGQATQFMRP